jgi:hypothetical protein
MGFYIISLLLAQAAVDGHSGDLVLFKTRQMLSRTVFGSSLAGDAMLVRLRSTSIALLALVTAIGLGLVAFISQLGWPGVVNSPIPNNPVEAGAVHNAIALTHGHGHGPTLAPPSLGHAPRSHAAGGVAQARGHAVPAQSSNPGLGGSHQPGGSSDGQSVAVAQPQPTSIPAASEPQTISPAPSAPAAPVTAVVETPQTSPVAPLKDSSASSSPSGSPSGGPSTAKVTRDSDVKSSGSSPGVSKGQVGGKDSHQSIPSKSSGDPASKAAEDAATAAPPAVTPPTTEPVKSAATATDYGTSKEAWDAGKSDKRRH